jgi:hypothetical protein
VNSKNSLTSVKCKQNFGEPALIKVSFTSSEKVSFTITQTEQKSIRKSLSKDPDFLRLVIGKENEGLERNKSFPIKYISGACGFEESLTVTYDCEPGDYYAWVEIQGKNLEDFSSFVFSVYCNDITLIQVKGLHDAIDFLPNVMKSMAKIKGEHHTYEAKDEPDIFRCLGIDESYTKLGYLYYENNSKESTIKEEVTFIEHSGISIIGDDNNVINVEVPPGEQRIYILDQVGKTYTMKCGYFTSIHKPDRDVEKNIKLIGEKKQIKFGEDLHEIFYYVKETDDGYFWMFENETDDIIFEGKFIYTLNNLKITPIQEKSDEHKVTLKPGEKKYMRMIMIDNHRSWGYKCKCAFHCDHDISTEHKLIDQVLKHGEKQQVICKAELIDVFYYIHFINDQYVWYFINQSDKKFNATFRFTLDNLRLEEDKEAKPEGQWKIFLEPGEKCLKNMYQLDRLQNSKYECSYSCGLNL